jgi:hypothetical protein
MRRILTGAGAALTAAVLVLSATAAGAAQAAAGSRPAGPSSGTDKPDRCEKFIYRHLHKKECEKKADDTKKGDDKGGNKP